VLQCVAACFSVHDITTSKPKTQSFENEQVCDRFSQVSKCATLPAFPGTGACVDLAMSFDLRKTARLSDRDREKLANLTRQGDEQKQGAATAGLHSSAAPIS